MFHVTKIDFEFLLMLTLFKNLDNILQLLH